MKIHFLNSSIICEAKETETILLACARSGIFLSAPCGSRSNCGKCRVRLLEGQVTGDLADSEGRVYACKAVPLTDIVISVPDNYSLINNEVSSTTMLDSTAMLDSKAKKKPLSRAGVALDIGTTTISARLIDLDKASPVDTISELNNQRAFGADIMSRIAKAREGFTADIFSAINRQTENILKTFMDNWNLNHIEKLTVSGNTTMLHFFLNTDPSGMGLMPFTPVFLEERKLKGSNLSLSAETVFTLPSISAFIGGDITAGLAAIDFLHTQSPALFIDIGTNGEMALLHQGEILCCSTAAGAAFEGAEISCGIGGVSGAICLVELAGNDIIFKTIGNTPPRGICGSGLIDAVALMLQQGIIDETGSMGIPEHTLTPGIIITQKDIRQFQLAKSAINSGIRLLCMKRGLNINDIKNIFISGGLGFFVNIKNACNTGLLPKELLDNNLTERIFIVGNTSLRGTEEILFKHDFIDLCREIIRHCSLFDIAKEPAFMAMFADNMLFG
jgi:uncharacterized 2Fe-2S/4Fe-4S cluster protein (DUF4445 family)